MNEEHSVSAARETPEEETPAAEPAPRSPTAALWAGFRREEPLLCLTADARQIARTMWQEGGHLCP